MNSAQRSSARLSGAEQELKLGRPARAKTSECPKPPSHPLGCLALGSSYCLLPALSSLPALLTLAPSPLLLTAPSMLGPPTVPQGVHWHYAHLRLPGKWDQDKDTS